MNSSKPLIKFYRHEGKRLIIIPTAEGLEYFKNNPEKQGLVGEKLPNGGIRLVQSEYKVGGANLISLEAELDSAVVNVSTEQNVPLNYFKLRAYTLGQINYYLNLPFTLHNGESVV